jgi:hypothetical protein
MSETLPPLTAEALEADLINEEFSAYLYIGSAADLGWKFAQTAFKLVPRLRIYLILDRVAVAKWAGNSNPAGIVFGWDDKVYRRFDKAEAENLQLVLDIIAEAMNT